MSRQSTPEVESVSESISQRDLPREVPVAMTSKEAATIWQRAAYRWAAITAVLAMFLCLYTQHPYYQGGTFAPWRPFFTGAFVVWLVLGLLYCKVTLEKYHERRYMMRDGGLLLLVIFKRLWERKRFLAAFRGKRIRNFCRTIAVKAFFTPLMAGFLSGHITTIMDMWLRHRGFAPIKFNVGAGNALSQAQAWWSQLFVRIPDLFPRGVDVQHLFTAWTQADVKWSLDWAYNWIFFVDCGFAFIGYSTESRWLGNKTKSAEPTAFGWLICLCCYPPFNNVLGTYLPLHDGARHDVFTGETADIIFKAATVLLFSIYASATVAFGFKFSNLTNRGIISRGPYRFVRHPAYLTKCSAWWLEHMPTMTLTKAFFLTCLCGVYALRAWTEERHLSKDPDYLVYKKKTPWVLFPGIY